MILCMTLLVRDEEDILRANLDYHYSRGVDLVIATDNRSQDRTPEILRDYEREGRLKYIYEPSDDYSQDLWVTRMAVLAKEHMNADWVIHSDADEFWWSETGSLKDALSEVSPQFDGVAVERTNFVALSSWSDEQPFYSQMIYRSRISTNPLGGPLPPKVAHRAFSDIYIEQGNHAFKISGRSPRTSSSHSLEIFHYPLRSRASYERKIALGGAAYARNTRLDKSIGRTWRELYRQHLGGGLDSWFQAQLLDLEAIRTGLDKGALLEDNRLSEYLRRLYLKGVQA